MMTERLSTVKEAFAFTVVAPFLAAFISASIMHFIQISQAGGGIFDFLLCLVTAVGMTGFNAIVAIIMHMMWDDVWPGWVIPIAFVLYEIIFVDQFSIVIGHLIWALILGFITMIPAILLAKMMFDIEGD